MDTASQPAGALPVRDGLFTEDGLIGGECHSCHRRHFPVSTICPWCGADAVATVALATEGTLWAWTAVNAPPPGFEGDVPYGFGVVELAADGLHVITRLTESDPGRLRAGQPMRFTVTPLTATVTTWAFAPA